MALGDSDIGIIKEVDNEIKRLKDVSDYITANLYDNGIEKALRHFKIIFLL